MKRTKQEIKRELDRTIRRLDDFYDLEQKLLESGGVQSYTIGSRSLSKYNLTEVENEIEKLEKRKKDLENELAGRKKRRSLGVIPRDW
jgi:hypothetical protein